MLNSKYIINLYDDNLHRVQVITLWERVFGYDAAHNRPELVIDKKLAVADDLFFVAVKAEEVIGTVMAGYDGHRGWIYSLAVAPEYRRQGIAKALMDRAEQSLTRLGCLKVNLQIIEGNQDVVEFYQSLGYSTEARISMGKRIS